MHALARLPRAREAARLARAAALALLLAACGGDPASPPPPDPNALPAGTYALVRADGQALPATIADERVGGGTLRTFADEATITVTADGRWTQRAALRTLRLADGVLLGRPDLGDRGRWMRLPDGAHLLTSELQAWRPASRVRVRDDGTLEVTERLAHELGGLVVGEYRRR